jgi:hypothetical protein
MAAGTAAIRELLSDQRTQEFLESVVGRRPAIKCLAVLGAVGIGALVGAVVAEEMIPPVVSQIRDQEWIALLARAPRRDLL